MKFILLYILLIAASAQAAEICFTPNPNTRDGMADTLTKLGNKTRDPSNKTCKTQNGVIVPDGMSFVDCVEPG
jgi:hypothetical protein